jgi:hypothetical protein
MNKSDYIDTLKDYYLHKDTITFMLAVIMRIKEFDRDTFELDEIVSNLEHAMYEDNSEDIAENLELFDIEFKEIMKELDDDSKTVLEEFITEMDDLRMKGKAFLVTECYTNKPKFTEYIPKFFFEKKLIIKFKGEQK